MRLTGQKEANHLAKMGSCTEQDIRLMEGMGGGWEAGTFPELGEKCGKQSWKFNGTYSRNKHVECVQSDLPISTACGSCFALQGEYGFSNCKGACWMNWCSKQCVKCMDKYADTLNDCVGVVPPGVWACDGSGYKPKPKPLKGKDVDELISHTHVNNPSPHKPVIRVPATPMIEVPATPVVEVPAPFVQTGKCTEGDMKAMNAAGPGPETGSFASSCAACGSSSVSWTMQMQDSKYKKCLQGKVPISGSCASCFLDSAKYGLGNCKMPCMSNWCSKGCLECIDNYQPEVRKCVGFAPPGAWSCDGSGYGVTVPPAATTATTTPLALAWQPEQTLPVGHSISFYNSESRRFLRMTENGLVGGPEKGEISILDDDERFIVVDASDDGSGDLVALYSQVHRRFMTLANNADTPGADIGSVPAATPAKPKQGWTIERIAVVSVAGFGNVKAVALGCAAAGDDAWQMAPKDEEPEAFIEMGTGGALTTVRELPRELPLTRDSEAGTTFVIIAGEQPDQDRNRTWPPPLVEPETSPAIAGYSIAEAPGPSMTALVCGGVALLLLGAAGGYFLARRKLLGAGGEREWTNMAPETPHASGGVIS